MNELNRFMEEKKTNLISKDENPKLSTASAKKNTIKSQILMDEEEEKIDTNTELTVKKSLT